MRIRIGDKYEEWDTEILEARRRSSREAAERYTPDFDEGWLTLWARNATFSLYSIIEGILAEPYGESEAPYHCGQPLRRINGEWGDFYRCRVCEFKGGWATIHTGRKKSQVEWRTERWKKAIDMNQNGCYFVCRESQAPLGITAGQMGLG